MLVTADLQAHPDATAAQTTKRVVAIMGVDIPADLEDDDNFERFASVCWSTRNAYLRVNRKRRKEQAQA